MKITLVKKILADGSPCKKCGDVLNKLEQSGQMERIDQVLVADERDETSEGMVLAKQYSVDRAPFFIVENEGQEPVIYTVYMKFVKEVLDQKTEETDELKEIMADNQDLDFL
ncbi:hypothetical protein [Saccharophagus degradans]|uniref:Thioredoxin-like fold domain-containing protein n=1 Tax=Saccharophagus degradans TaxID=86304 RepID=A0AAW7X9H2_9GAMM|nr:hypothetical protein [Saccharophagus degradans]MDO6424262.1 hypothetical protein [Saccharophagus degradans]MDO6608309.1 hypothetical protein [Saccharophagus degradans]